MLIVFLRVFLRHICQDKQPSCDSPFDWLIVLMLPCSIVVVILIQEADMMGVCKDLCEGHISFKSELKYWGLWETKILLFRLFPGQGRALSNNLLSDGRPDDLPLVVLLLVLHPPLPLCLLDGLLPRKYNL